MSFCSATLLALALTASRLLRCSTVSLVRSGLRSSSVQDGQACTELVNHGLYFTVDVEVGTPGQTFGVVADTGSNTLIVPSCICQKEGSCSSKDRCFTGTGHSSTFTVVNSTDGSPMGLLLSFGSGTIQGVLVQDVVRVGGLEQYMRDGLLLMTSKQLKFGGSFEGILGLGIPRPPEPVKQEQVPVAQPSTWSHRVPDVIQKIIQRITGASFVSAPGAAALRGASASPGLTVVRDVVSESGDLEALVEHEFGNGTLQLRGAPLQPGGFLEQAGIARFSICFNDGSSGVLRIRTPKMQNAHGSVGKVHWGLDLRGLSVGKQEVPVQICTPQSMAEGQQTACGAIPDSGTTLITAPVEHLSLLYDSLCDAWDRCRQKHSENKMFSKKLVLEHLLLRCESWLGEGSGLGELPPIHFQVAGSSGTQQTLTLDGNDYVYVTSYKAAGLLEDSEHSLESVGDFLASTHGAFNVTKVCKPAFGPHKYTTAVNGPIWILGTPFFYQFNVGYDLSTVPASISFSPTSETPCGACDKAAGLVVTHATPGRKRSPHWLEGQPRMPSVDVNSPL